MFRCSSCGALNRVSSGQSGTAVCGRCKGDLDRSGAPQEIDAEALERLVASASVPVVVDFWAPWCGPCRAVAPIFDRYARDHAGHVIVVKVNSDDHPQASQRYDIRGIPTFIVFRGGAEIGRRSGALPYPQLDAWLTPLLESAASTHA